MPVLHRYMDVTYLDNAGAIVEEQKTGDIRSIQVDGGSEFRDEFGMACKELNIALFALPPNPPNLMAVWNAPMAQLGMTFIPLYEGALTVEAVNRRLDDFQSHDNEYRPHDSLDLATPFEYYQNLKKETRLSHRY